MPPRTKKERTKKRGSARLGRELRDHREKMGWSLREVANRAGVNHGYLSILERGDVAEPAPSMLHKLATGYQLPFVVLMRWAGYVESDTELSENQLLALSYFGNDISDVELEAVRAVLEVIRSRGATFSANTGSLDVPISHEDRMEIRKHVTALLRKADCLHVVPTPLDQVMDVSKLVLSGEITLEASERRLLRHRFGDLVDLVMDRLRGAVAFRSQEVWIKADMHEMRRRFVTAHEIGHFILPWQRDVSAYLDDNERLRPDVTIMYERQANQAAIDILAHGDLLRKELDDSPLNMDLLGDAADKYQISLQAMFRYAVEESRQSAAAAIRFRGAHAYGPTHLYCSTTFSARFGWGQRIPAEVSPAITAARKTGQQSSVMIVDLAGVSTTLEIEVLDTPYAVLALIVPEVKRGKLMTVLKAS